MNDTKPSNANDFKVVEFYNSTNFDFTPELGAMYDGRPFFVGSGEKRQLPYHVGHLLAKNLAKAVLVKGAPMHDPNSINPVGTPLWGEEGLIRLKNSFLTELYVEDKPLAQTETDRLMAKVAELERMFKEKHGDEPVKHETKTVEDLVLNTNSEQSTDVKEDAPKVYQDKAEVIAELTKRGIKFDARKSKVDLETLLA